MTLFESYANSLADLAKEMDWSPVEELSRAVKEVWTTEKQLFFCGNGGSAGNAIHLANDFVYGCAYGVAEKGLRVQALPANAATLTCLANDVGFESVFSIQLKAFAQKDDLLVVFSGSGNSPNIVAALQMAKQLNVKTAAVLGFDGGQAKELADIVVHFPIDDMQISEDMQLVVGHMVMRWLRENI